MLQLGDQKFHQYERHTRPRYMRCCHCSSLLHHKYQSQNCKCFHIHCHNHNQPSIVLLLKKKKKKKQKNKTKKQKIELTGARLQGAPQFEVFTKFTLHLSVFVQPHEDEQVVSMPHAPVDGWQVYLVQLLAFSGTHPMGARVVALSAIEQSFVVGSQQDERHLLDGSSVTHDGHKHSPHTQRP